MEGTNKASVHVDFPVPFAKPPAIVASVDTGYPQLWDAGAYNHAADGCDIVATCTTTSTSSSVWVSVVAVAL